MFLVHSFLHYGFFGGDIKDKTYFTIELQRNILFCMVFYYYIDKAYSLLKNRKVKKLFLQIVFCIYIISLFTLGICQVVSINMYKGCLSKAKNDEKKVKECND